MSNEPARGLFWARFQGLVYAILHATVRHTFIGATIRGWLINLPLLVALFLVLTGEPIGRIIVIVVAALLLRLLYWKARRDGYVRFLDEETPHPGEGVTVVGESEKVPVKATGVFSVKDWQEYILAGAAEYWRVPMGDHAVMVNYAPGRFMYQFIRLGSIEQIQAGLLFHSRQPQKALAITFLTSWGPESEDPNFMFYAPSDESDPARKQRKMFLAFEDMAARDSVWLSLLSNGRQQQNEDS
jgi:hypothetical protein